MSVHRAPNAEKGARYLGLLDKALCDANWSEVPEWARKVEKHAPERKTLTLAARAEAQASYASHRPTSASSATATSIHGLGECIPQLIEAISAAENSTYPDDAAIASTCLAQVYWLQESPLEALHILGSSAAQAQSTDTSPSTLGWLEVCQVKNAFISAACLEASGRQSEARESYQAAVLKTPGYRSPELRTWTERLLGRACMYSVKKMPSPSIHDLHETYTAFRAWGEFWQRVPSSTPFTPFSGRWDVSRRQVWKAYHELLSTILQQDVLYSPYQDAAAESFIPSTTILPSEQITTVKQRQRAEMIRIEKTYESILLAEMKFPKASEINAEVEEWVKQVVANWRIFTSRWTDTELGEGGKDAVSRNVLEILYRAATKTFHSTAILRQLFTVHAALGEFDLAMHAFDSYVEIIDRGKARSEKTGHHEEGLDDDDTAMLTAAEAVRLLCRYGDREQGEKANEIIGAMSKWLAQQPPIAGNDSQNGEKAEEETTSSSPRIDSSLKPSTLAAAYRAMGICQAHWAQLTYDSASRPSLLADATKNLRRAQRFDPQSVDTAHALALVLAEMRDVSGSLQVLRSALQDSVMLNGDVASEQHCDRERRLLSMWHLLALCLTGQDKYDTAAQICEAAYKQFGSARVLFGQASVLAQGIPENSVSIVPPTQGLASQMESYEKECILQVRMSQLLLIELTEGPDAAVNLTDSLFGLYNKLFGNPSTVVAAPTLPPQTAASATPSRFGGTLRSITGSIRPRSARSRHSSCERRTITRQRSATVDASLVPAHDSRTATNDPSSGAPIAITVTNEDGNSAGKPHHRHHLHVPFRHRDNSSSVSTASENKEEGSTPRVKPRANSTAAADLGASSKQQLDNVAHNASAGQLPRPTGHEDQPPVQDVRLPGPHPAAVSGVPESTLLPKHERRHKVSVLLQTWLFVAEMYVRAEAHDEAQNAIEDAFKLVTALENEHGASDDGSNARKLYQKGWGGGKSIDVLWADAWSTKAHLALARDRPFEAMAAFEQALSFDPDHDAAIIGLSILLMDIYEGKMPAEEPLIPAHPLPVTSESLINEAKPTITRPNTATTEHTRQPSLVSQRRPEKTRAAQHETSPADLNRLAARDRAYMLLSNLTKQGMGWDNSEAWHALARAHELSREIGKAKQALWWVVELEDSKPLRPWREVVPGRYTL